MKKIFRAAAVAILMATGAQAATVSVSGVYDQSNAPVTGDLMGGTAYIIGIRVSGLDPLPSDWPVGDKAQSQLWLTISDGNSGPLTLFSGGNGDAGTLEYLFQWRWSKDGPATLTFSEGYLQRYRNGVPGGTIVWNGTSGPLRGDTLFGDPVERFTATLGAASATPTPVPIGGTLPLMLSALGLGAWVIRRRAKGAALA